MRTTLLDDSDDDEPPCRQCCERRTPHTPSSVCSPPLTLQCRPQQARSQNVQNVGAPPFPQSTEPLFLDPNAAAKQMAALNVVNMQRQLTNAYPRPLTASSSQVSLGRTSPGSYLGGMHSPYNQSNALQPAMLDAPAAMQFAPHSGLQVQPAYAPVHGHQPNHASMEPSMPSSSAPPRHSPNVMSSKQKQRSFLASLAQVHLSRGSPLPPALTAVQYPPNYDPASSQWKNLECSTEIGAFRLAGKDVDLFKLWVIVSQFGGGQKVLCQHRPSYAVIHSQSYLGNATERMVTTASAVRTSRVSPRPFTKWTAHDLHRLGSLL